ncbi:hypothetical protein BHM03_00056115 [Ensete ventricosum]|nr:hypothetical protein BHM03_00056115 [Ensete ventricosum]
MGFKAAQLQQNSLIAVWALGFTVENKNIALEIAIGYAAPTPRFSPLPLCCQAMQRPHCRLPALPTTVVPLRRLCDKGSRLQEMQNAAQSPPKPKPPPPPPAAGIGSTLFWSDGPLLLRSWALDTEGQDPVEKEGDPSKIGPSVVAEFSGLRSSTCVTFATNARDASFSDVLAAQLSTKTAGAVLVKGETIAKLKVAINGFGRIGRNFLRCWHSRNDSPLEVVVVNDSGGVKNV